MYENAIVGKQKFFDENKSSLIILPLSIGTESNTVTLAIYKTKNYMSIRKCSADEKITDDCENIYMPTEFADIVWKWYSFNKDANGLQEFVDKSKENASLQNEVIKYMQEKLFVFDYNYCRYLIKQKRFDEAETHINKYLKINTYVETMYYDLACLYSLKKKYEDAIYYLKKSIINGFVNWIRIVTDPNLDNIKYYPQIVDEISVLVNLAGSQQNLQWWAENISQTDKICDYISRSYIDSLVRVTEKGLSELPIPTVEIKEADVNALNKISKFNIFKGARYVITADNDDVFGIRKPQIIGNTRRSWRHCDDDLEYLHQQTLNRLSDLFGH